MDSKNIEEMTTDNLSAHFGTQMCRNSLSEVEKAEIRVPPTWFYALSSAEPRDTGHDAPGGCNKEWCSKDDWATDCEEHLKRPPRCPPHPEAPSGCHRPTGDPLLSWQAPPMHAQSRCLLRKREGSKNGQTAVRRHQIWGRTGQIKTPRWFRTQDSMNHRLYPYRDLGR